jgi:hypothetical protein
LVLDAQPSDSVIIYISSPDEGEGNVSTSSIGFVAKNWDTAQTVTLTGVGDDQVDGDIVYSMQLGGVVSSDTRFHGTSVGDVMVTNIDRKDPVSLLNSIVAIVSLSCMALPTPLIHLPSDSR